MTSSAEHAIDINSLGRTFSDCRSFVFERQVYDVVDDAAYTAGSTGNGKWFTAMPTVND